MTDAPARIALFMSRLGLDHRGGASRAAELLGVKRAAVSLWLKGRREISQPVLMLMDRLETDFISAPPEQNNKRDPDC